MKLLLHIFLLSILLTGCTREWDEPLLIAYDDANNIFIMDEDGKNIRQMTTAGSSTHPSFSPDGEYLVYRRLNSLYIMNIETGVEKFLTAGTVIFPSFTWSPDGLKIAFFDNGFLYTINADGTGLTQISLTNNNQIPVTWTSDSKIILCSNNLFSLINYYNQNSPVSNPILTYPLSGVNALSFSPDATAVAYMDLSNFYIANTDFTSPRLLTSASDVNFSWSPGGKRLVYESSAGELRIINAAGGAYSQITGPGRHNPCFQYKPR
jgi:TolB protein